MGQHQPKTRTQQFISNAFAIALVGVFGLLATGCSNKNNSATNNVTQVRVWRVDQDIDSFRDLINQFQRENENVKVTYTKKQLDTYEFDSLKSLAGRLGPDIWSIPNDWLGDYTDQVIPLPDNFFFNQETNKGPSPVDAVRAAYPAGIANQIIDPAGTKVYGLPTNVDTLQLYVNSDLLSQAYQDFRKAQGNTARDEVLQPVRQLLNKAPATWNDVVEQAKYITKRNGSTIERAAIALGTADNIPNSGDILQLLMLQNGAKILSDDHMSAVFDVSTATPSGGQVRAGQKALEFFTSFSDPSKETYSWNPSMPQALDAFTQGKVAMVIAYSDFGKQLKIKKPGFSYEVAAIPQVSLAQDPVNFIRFSVETVTKTADNANAAFAFLQTYTNTDNAKILASEQKLYSPYLKYLNNAAIFQATQILTGQGTYKVVHTQFDAAFRQMIVDVSQNQILPEEAIKSGSDKIDNLVNPKPTPSSTPAP